MGWTEGDTDVTTLPQSTVLTVVGTCRLTAAVYAVRYGASFHSVSARSRRQRHGTRPVFAIYPRAVLCLDVQQFLRVEKSFMVRK
jgi:hypothetical protein